MLHALKGSSENDAGDRGHLTDAFLVKSSCKALLVKNNLSFNMNIAS